MKINELLLNRESPRSFDTTYNISDKDILTITEAMRLSPAAYGLLSLRTVVIKRNEKIRKELLPFFYNQKNVEEASAIVLFVVSNFDKLIDTDIPYLISQFDDNTTERVKEYEKRMTRDMEHGRKDPTLIDWTNKEAFIALGAALAVAEDIEIDTCPIDGMNKPNATNYLISNNIIGANEKLATALLLGKRNLEIPKKKKIRLNSNDFTKIHD